LIAGIEVKRLMSKVTFDDWIDDDDEHSEKNKRERAAGFEKRQRSASSAL